MLLTLRNLPLSMRYPDVKALIQSKCGSMQVILDNLVQNNEYKIVTVGLADEGDAAIFSRKINGLFVDGCQLYVEDSRHKKSMEQPYRPMHFGVAPEISTMLPSNLENSGMPQKAMDPKIGGGQYGMFHMNMQNPAMVYHQQFMPVMTTGQLPVEPQTSYVSNNRTQSGNREDSNVRDSYESYKRQDHDWDNGPVTKQSRYDKYSPHRDEPRPRSPNRNSRHPKYDYPNRKSDNIKNPHANISYPLHLYSRQNVPSTSKPNTRPDVVTSNYDNPHGSPIYSQNLQRENCRDKISEKSSNIRRETRVRPVFAQDPPLGFNTEPKRKSHFDEVHGGKRAKYDENLYRRPGFDRDSPKGFSDSRRRKRRPRVHKKKSYDLGTRLVQEPTNRRAFDNDPPNKRPGGSSFPGFDQDSSYSDNRGHRQHEPGKDRYFDQNASSSVKPREKPWSIFHGSGISTENRNQRSLTVSKPNDNRYSNNAHSLFEKSLPNFGEDFIPIGGGSFKYPPLMSAASRQDQREHAAQVFRSALAKKVSQPNDNPPAEVSSAMNIHTNTIFHTAASIARGIIRSLQLQKKEARAMLKPLKQAIRARFDVLLGDTLCKSPMLAEKIYRRKYPVNQDYQFFEKVLQKLENCGQNNNEGSVNAPSTSAPPKQQLPPVVSEKSPGIVNLATITAVKDGNVPKYPNADKNIMKQQKQLGKQEYLVEDFYKLPELTKNALEQELDELCNIFNNECGNVENQMERTVTERIISTSLPEFRRSVKLNATKRILNINANLYIRIYFYGKQPNMADLKKFLKDYGVVSCRKSVKNPIFLASVDSYDNYDRLLALNNAKLGDTLMSMKPLQVTGYKVRPNVKKGKKQNKSAPKLSTNETVSIFEITNKSDVTQAESLNKQILVKQEKSEEIVVKQENSEQIVEKRENSQQNVEKRESSQQNVVKQETCDKIKLNKEASIDDFNDVDISDFAEEDLEDY